jgi:hypothetical protein
MTTPVPNFKEWADAAAVNEACDTTDDASRNCSYDNLCPFCMALSKQIEVRLVKAFLAGQQSVSEAAKLQSPHRA